jgi:organic hydroperoxide reductase OsmC/OhrA
MAAPAIESVRVSLRREDQYRFEVDWGTSEAPRGRLDESPPIGRGTGPNASRLVAAAVAHCLASSLLFCLEKSHAPVDALEATATAEIRRNERGRWRLARIRVRLDPRLPSDSATQFRRCQGLFEDFCIVTESIRHGVPVDVEWATALGVRP